MPTASASHCPAIEPLEARIAPASTFVFTDVDGDIVTIKSSIGTIADAGFAFSPVGPGPKQLQLLLLNASFDNTDLTITVKAVPGGNGSVTVGRIQATGVDLNSVSIAGDLGRINAGGGDPAAKVFGVGSLTVDSMGRGGLAAQDPDGSFFSIINGRLGKLTVKGDVYHSSIAVQAGGIGTVSIGGSLIGGDVQDTGSIHSFVHGIDSVKIGGSVIGSAEDTGTIFSAGKLGSVTIGGDLVGGTGDTSGAIFSDGDMGAVTVKGSILGNPLAERNSFNVGSISAEGAIKSLTVGGDIIGGGGMFGGYVRALGAIGAVKITGDVRGDNSVYAQNNAILDFAASFSGGVQSATSMGNVSVGGSVIGGIANYSGVLFVGNEDIADNEATPGVGLVGDPGENPGIDVPFAVAGNMGTVTIKGSVIGGGIGIVNSFPNGLGGAASGWIKADGAIGAVKITGDVIGSVGQYSGAVQARGIGEAAGKTTIASATIGGSVRGGQGFDSGAIFAGSPDVLIAVQPTATALGPVKITGSLISGFGNLSGTVYSDTLIQSVSIGGSILGDSSGDVDLVLLGGGAIITNGSLGTVSIKGGIYGEFGPAGGGIYAFGGGIKSVSIGRDLTGSTSTTGIYATGAIGSVSVGGSIAGTAPAPAPVFGIGVVFILSDTAISKLTVKGRVENADILAGSNYYNAVIGAVENADAQIGAVSVGLDWIASNLAAGTNSSNANFFGFGGAQTVAGSNLDPLLASRIASITIKGNVHGTPDSAGDGFGFFAQQIGPVKIRGVAQIVPAAGTTILGDPLLSDVVLTTFGGS